MSDLVVSHRTDVRAPADTVFRIVADVSRWPLYFPPTVWAERVDGDDRKERVRLWAMAEGAPRTWESERRLDPGSRTVRFEQTAPRHPVASMGGVWTVHEAPGGGCTVVLDHHYRAVDDDPADLERIGRAVDGNSVAELDSLRRAAENRFRESERLLRFSDSATIHGPLREAYDFLNDADKWADRLPHVSRIDLRETEPGLQRLEMDTRSPDGTTHTTVSGRVCFAPERIVYKQTRLPPLLVAHTGEWRLEEAPGGAVTVTSTHEVIIDAEALTALPDGPADLAQARRAVRDALGANSRTTLAAAKAFVESGSPAER